VLLLEAGGPDDRPEIPVPSAWPTLLGTEIDWGYLTEPEPHLLGRRVPWSRGKVLGGSSSVNGSIYVRGNRRDYDHWNWLGNPGWAYEDVLPYFIRSEGQQHVLSKFHGEAGELLVSDSVDPSPLSLAFVDAAEKLGFERCDDFNGPHQEGAGLLQFTVANGVRQSTAVAFLRPILGHDNLQIVTNAHATRLTFESDVCVGVRYRTQGGSTVDAEAAREVILCAGSMESPKLLMLSGVGPAGQLSEMGVDVLADLPGVGANLQDHLLVPVCYAAAENYEPSPTNLGDASLFARSGPGLDAASPDLQLLLAQVPFLPEGYAHDGPGFTFLPTLVRPQSTGRLTLRSTDPFDPPRIQANYLECRWDLLRLREGLKLSRQLAESEPLSRYRGPEIAPGADVSADAEVEEYVRRAATTLWHPVGTCKMGHDREAVVDSQLRVHGVRGLRVADASIMPTIPAGNTNAPSIMIGEKAAAMILETA
jgi:choline dehydrogenase